MSGQERVIALWFPDWPVTALRRSRGEEPDGPDPDAPVALVRAGRVTACSPSARASGVRRGQRRRDAQSACPALSLVAADEARDARAFAEPLRLIEELSPGVQAPRPGLALLPVDALGDDATARFLTSLGIRTLGGFADLAESLVRERLGEEGAFRHACARGADPRRVSPQPPPPDLARELALEPPLELAEQVAFAARRTAESFIEALGGLGLVCTAVRIALVDERGRRSERVWQHPTSFDAPGVVDRIRWQLEEAANGPAGAISLLRLEPEATDDQAAHQPALLGQGPDERAHHAMTRLQAVLGHRGVLSPSIGGGRSAADREVLRPWADDGGLPPAGPWPGSLPPPLPAEVFRPPRAAEVRGAAGSACLVDERGLLTTAPETLDGARIVSWAGPWPLVERDWDSARARSAHRFQFVTDRGAAWLVSLEGGSWRIEGRYG